MTSQNRFKECCTSIVKYLMDPVIFSISIAFFWSLISRLWIPPQIDIKFPEEMEVTCLGNLWKSRNCTPTGSRFPCAARVLKSQVGARWTFSEVP